MLKSSKNTTAEKIQEVLEASYIHLEDYVSTKNLLMYCFDGKEIVDIKPDTELNFGLLKNESTKYIPNDYSVIIGISNYIMKNPNEVVNRRTRSEIQAWIKEHNIAGEIGKSKTSGKAGGMIM